MRVLLIFIYDCKTSTTCCAVCTKSKTNLFSSSAPFIFRASEMQGGWIARSRPTVTIAETIMAVSSSARRTSQNLNCKHNGIQYRANRPVSDHPMVLHFIVYPELSSLSTIGAHISGGASQSRAQTPARPVRLESGYPGSCCCCCCCAALTAALLYYQLRW